MILDRSIVEAPCFKSFLHIRRILRDVQKNRVLISSMLCTINHAIARYEQDGTVFDKHRVSTLREQRSRLADHMHRLTKPLEGLEFSFYNMLLELSDITSPEQKAHILGNTTAWLDREDPEWREKGLFELIFVTLAENERHDTKRHGLPPLLWFCSRIIAKVPRKEVLGIVLRLREKLQKEDKPRLRLVKS